VVLNPSQRDGKSFDLAQAAAHVRAMKWLVACLCLSGPALADPVIMSAEFSDPVTRYGHDALGAGHEWGALTLRIDLCPQCAANKAVERVFRLPEDMVFEDLTPRMVDTDRDGELEVLLVESSLTQGARPALWGPGGRIASGAYIGQSYRWLAMIGAADFDGDGIVELAWIETPHLGKILKIARREGDKIVVLASKAGLTNHHFGLGVIESAIVNCGTSATILTADANWSQVVATRFVDEKLTSVPVGPYSGPDDFQNLPDCN
jgi:hypothetical protein